MAKEKGGWIKLHRKLLDNPIVMKDADHLAVWIWILMNVTHDSYSVIFEGKRRTLLPGQMTVGRNQIAEKLRINPSKIKRILISLESDQQIGRQRSNKCSLISVTNWTKYQNSDQQDDQQATSKRPLNKNRKNVKKDTSLLKEPNELGFIPND